MNHWEYKKYEYIENIETHVIEWLRNSNDSDMQVTGIPIIKTWFGLLLLLKPLTDM